MRDIEDLEPLDPKDGPDPRDWDVMNINSAKKLQKENTNCPQVPSVDDRKMWSY